MNLRGFHNFPCAAGLREVLPAEYFPQKGKAPGGISTMRQYCIRFDKKSIAGDQRRRLR
jgi:hypothetical protein